MNNLLSASFSRSHSGSEEHAMQMAANPYSPGGVVIMDPFFQQVTSIEKTLQGFQTLNDTLQNSQDKIATLCNSEDEIKLRQQMDADVVEALKSAKMIKVQLEALDRSKAACKKLPKCEPGTASDGTRTMVVAGLRKKLKDHMDRFNRLRENRSNVHKETVRRRYLTATGVDLDEASLDSLIATGESDNLYRMAIQQQGKSSIINVASLIEENHDSVKELEKNLEQLHQVFLDMAVLVETQGEELNDIESNVQMANSFVERGTTQLQAARVSQKNTRKWTCYAILLVLGIILFAVLFAVRPWKSSRGHDGNQLNQPRPSQAQTPPPPPSSSN